MQFQIPDTDLTFDIPDDWWRFAEMDGFRPHHPNCYIWPSEAATERIDFSIVPISAIEPPTQRMATKPELAKARVVPILLAIRSGNPLPPVQLEAIGNDRYQLVAGFHRYCASIAAGFEQIPAVFHEIAWCKPRSGR
jgi:hypothetical protein